MKLIATTVLSSSQNITFSSIPQTFDDLVLLVSPRTSLNGGGFSDALSFNGSTANRTHRRLGNDGSTGINVNSSTDGNIAWTSGAQITANTFANSSIYIPNYRLSIHKQAYSLAVVENNASEGYMGVWGWIWADNAAVTSITYGVYGLIAGSTISLYGITNGTSNGVVVS
jgi:hypothetical protein